MNQYKATKIVAALFAIGISHTSMAATYEIDPTHANVRFAIDHFNTSTNTGGFYNLTGEVIYNPVLQQGSVTIDIPMDSLNTGNSLFNENLKGSDFFDVEKYPTAKFESTQWHFNPDAIANPLQAFADTDEDSWHHHRNDNNSNNEPKAEVDAHKRQSEIGTVESSVSALAVTQVDGLLTLHGQTHPVTLIATKFGCYFSPILVKKVCGGDFTTTIDRTKWGIDKYVLIGMSKDVTLNIQIEAAKR